MENSSTYLDGLNLNLQEWRSLLEERYGAPRYVADQICQWIYKKKVLGFNAMTNLSKALRAQLPQHIGIGGPFLAHRQISSDGTRKYLWRLLDGQEIESVILDHGNHYTACISSQVGCPLGCEFCATGRQGFVRNLTAGEIVGHFLAMEADLGRDIANVVFMGMGEPLLNYDNLLKAIRMLMDPKMRGLGVRHITISTSGIAPAIRRLADEGLGVYLCISLHAPNDEIRSRLMPINKSYSLAQTMDALRYWQARTGVRLTVEYVLLKNLNDTPECAYEMVTLLEDLQVYVNLIPYNPVVDKFSRPSASRIRPFMKILKDMGIETEIRREKGADIDAACGQLRGRRDR